MDDFVELEYRALKTVGYSYSLIANFLPVYAHQRKAMSDQTLYRNVFVCFLCLFLDCNPLPYTVL